MMKYILPNTLYFPILSKGQNKMAVSWKNLIDFQNEEIIDATMRQFDHRFDGYPKTFSLVEIYPDLRFVLRPTENPGEARGILQQLYCIRATFDPHIRIGSIYYSHCDDDIWLDVPCVMEE